MIPERLLLQDPRLTGMVVVEEDERIVLACGQWQLAGRAATTCLAKAFRGPRDELSQARMRSEARNLRRLAGIPGVPELLHADLDGGLLVITQPPGVPLAQRQPVLQSQTARCVRLVLSLADTLEQVHAAQAFHGGIRPEVLMLDAQADRLALTDVSGASAQPQQEARFVPTASLLRAQPFCAPEQTGRLGCAVDGRADLYALGALLYWLLSGRLPFGKAEPRLLLQALLTRAPEPLAGASATGLTAIVGRLLATSPDARYQSVAGLRADLLQALTPGRIGTAAFVAGRADRAMAPLAPVRLVGRDIPLQRLRAAVDAADGRRRVVLVHGESGSGKSTLLRALWRQLSEQDGLFAAGGHEGPRQGVPFAAMAAALTALADFAIAESFGPLAALRRDLASALGDNAPLLMRLVPGFAAVLREDPGAAAAAEDAADSSATDDFAAGDTAPLRVERSFRAVLDVLRERTARLVLFIEDLQWADAASVDLIAALAAGCSQGSVLFVAAYRDDGPQASPEALRAGLREAEVDVVDIALGPLPREAAAQLLGQMLGDAPPALQTLADALHRKTDGQAFFLVESVRRLFRDGALRRERGTWQWDDAALRALPAAVDRAAGLSADLRRLSAPVQQLAGWCACLGRRFEAGLLDGLIERTPEACDEQLLELMRRGVLADDGRDVRCLSFTHVRWREAAARLLEDDEGPRRHLHIGRHIATRGTADAGLRAAGHWLEALPLLRGAERSRTALLLVDAARAALARGAPARGLAWLDAGESLLGMRPSTPAPEEGDAVPPAPARGLLRHALLYRLGRHAELDAVFEQLGAQDLPMTPALAAAWVRQVRTLSWRGQRQAAAALAVEGVRRFGIEPPQFDAWPAAAERELQSVRSLLQARGETYFESLAPPAGEHAEAALSMLLAVPDRADPPCSPVRAWSALRALRLCAEQGACASLPLALIEAGGAFIALRDDFATGVALGRSALQLAQRAGSAVVRQRAHACAAALLSPWIEPLDATLQHARTMQRLARDRGDDLGASRAAAAAIAAQIDGAQPCGNLLADLDWALMASRRAEDAPTLAMLQAASGFVELLAGRRAAPDAHVDPAADGSVPADEPVALAHARLYRALGALVAGDADAALQLCRLADPAARGLYIDGTRRWAQALALGRRLRTLPAGEFGSMREELRALGAWLAARAREAPFSFAHLSAMVQACEDWVDGAFEPAMRGFEQAIDAARAYGHAWQHAFANELAAELYAARGLRRSAAMHVEAALRSWDECGAAGRGAALRAARRQAADPAGTAAEAGSAGVDLATVVQASRLLAQEEDPESLVRVLFELTRQFSRTERGVLFWGPGEWRVVAAFDGDTRWVEADGKARAMSGEEGAREHGVPLSVYQYMMHAKQPLLLADLPRHPRFGRDPVVRSNGVRSLIGMPIPHRGETVGLLYLEGRLERTPLELAEVEALHLVVQQFAVAFDNARMNRDLEQQVTRRTEELRRENAERRRAEQAADAANRAKGEFLANMSHEIRTPMNAILGMAHLALRSGLNPQQRNYIQKLESSAQSLLGLIGDILDFSKIDAGKLDMEHVPFQLGDVLDHMVNLVAMKAEEKGLELLFSEAAGVPQSLIGDPLRLGQVLVNLVSNAIKFTERGEIVIGIEETRREGSSTVLRFTVRDSGSGMTEAQLDRLFRPFSQADASISRRHGGTGLGLTISRHLVEMMDGRIGVESAPGAGSKFFFDAQFELQADADHTRQWLPTTLFGQLERARVLVVDDNPTARQILLEIAHALGWDVEEAADGWDAMRAVTLAAEQGRPFEVVVLDWKMPAMDGVECARQIAAVGSLGTAPEIVMMTALGREELQDRLATQKLRVADVLAKPVTPSTLFDAVATALGHAVSLEPRGSKRQETVDENRGRLRGARILLVEDNVINQELALELLSEARIATTVAEDGRQAIEVLRGGIFDGVLMDCQMPVMDGYEATRAIRREPQWKELPIIAMTANAMAGDREKALAAGMNDHIAKPIIVEAMFETIARWVRPARLREQDPRHVVETASDTQRLESLPGLDLRVGRVSTMNNDRLYVRLLIKFRDAQRDFAAQYRRRLAERDDTGIARMLHDLRAVAGSLGARGVQQAAQELDRAVREGSRPAQKQALLETLVREIEIVVGGLEGLGVD